MNKEVIPFCSYLPPSKKKTKKKPVKRNELISNITDIAENFFLIPGVKREQTPISKNKEKKKNVRNEKIKVNTKDLNIFHIDSEIQKKLESKIHIMSDLENELGKMLWVLQHSNNSVDKNLASKKASMLRQSIQDLETSLELALYMFKTSDILEEYRSLIDNSGPQSFINLNPQKPNSADRRKKELISQFLCVAKDYIEIENNTQNFEKIICPECSSIDFDFDDENSIYVCKDCRVEIEILDDSPSFKDTDRVNMSSRFSYTRRGHFITSMKRFQGTQNVDPKKINRVVDVLKEQMELHGLTKETVTKDQLYMFLADCKFSKHYEDLNLLYHIITEKPCPNISHVEDKILELFDKQEAALCVVLEDVRDNSLNVNYKLYKLLQKVNFPCKKDDFYILKTKTKEDEHDDSMKKAWKLLDWTWINT